MPKRTPLPCTPANCGEAFPKCGSRNTYASRKYKCRCDSCYEANAEYLKKYYSENRETVLEKQHRYYAENREAAAERRKRHYAKNREAIIERERQYVRKNSRKVAERQRRHREANREKIAEDKKRQYQENREFLLERSRQWRLANPDRYREHSRQHSHRRRARMRATQVVDFTLEQMEQRYAYYGHKCYLKLDCCTGAFDHVDHVKPIAKGGSHILANLRPTCKPCNERKSDQWPFKFAA